jgi:hypothetical protein
LHDFLEFLTDPRSIGPVADPLFVAAAAWLAVVAFMFRRKLVPIHPLLVKEE